MRSAPVFSERPGDFHGSLIPVEICPFQCQQFAAMHTGSGGQHDYGMWQVSAAASHTHNDHLDRMMLDRLKKPSTIFLGSPAVIDMVNCHCQQVSVVDIGKIKMEMGIGV